MKIGPVLPIIRYSDVDEVIARANDNLNGLGGSVWSKDVQHAKEIALQLQCGTAWINKHSPSPAERAVRRGEEFGHRGEIRRGRSRREQRHSGRVVVAAAQQMRRPPSCPFPARKRARSTPAPRSLRSQSQIARNALVRRMETCHLCSTYRSPAALPHPAAASRHKGDRAPKQGETRHVAHGILLTRHPRVARTFKLRERSPSRRHRARRQQQVDDEFDSVLPLRSGASGLPSANLWISDSAPAGFSRSPRTMPSARSA